MSGTSIGVGMLAMPIATAASGFIPAFFIYALCWLFMLSTGLLILEACIWMPKDSNLITLSSRLLGKWGKTACWILYLFLFSCLMIAHVASGGDVVHQLSGAALPFWLSTLCYVLVFGAVVFVGTLWVDRLNLVLILGVALSFICFLFLTAPYIHPKFLARSDWSKVGWALPVVFTAFGYQSLVPTLYNYMNRNVVKVRLAIILGTAIPFALYILWEVSILGVVPFQGKGGLLEILKSGQNALSPLSGYLHNPTLLIFGQAFAFFAMTTSFLGISIAFLDFLADGLKVQKRGMHRIALCALIFGIPTLVTWINPFLFLEALRLAGGIGVALLLGALPALMVWAGRYYAGHSLRHQQLPGGKFTLSALLAFVLLTLTLTLLSCTAT